MRHFAVASTLLALLLSYIQPTSAETCGAGRYCASENTLGTNACEVCPVGFYCPGQASEVAFGDDCWGRGEGGDNAPRIACGEGKASAEGSTSSSDCSSNMQDVVPSIAVGGICAGHGSYNGIYEPVALTKSGRPWYRNENGGVLYWDPKCDGTTTRNEWIFDNNEPSVTAESDLDGEWREVVEERK